MFKSKIVFILGAGASAEVGLPVGTGLAQDIARTMALDFDTIGHLEGQGDKVLFLNATPSGLSEIYLAAAHRLRDGLPLSKSIDEFLDRHHSDAAMVSLGKAAIVRAVLQREAKSALFFEHKRMDSSIAFDDLRNTWLLRLMYMLRQSDPARIFENAAFVCFNYDRCLEHFLFYAVRALCALDDSHTQQVLTTARIYHPYGYLGPIPELGPGGGVAFGNTARMDWAQLSARIRTFTEEIGAPTILEKMREEVRGADVLVFLGFGFHRQNMQLLAEPRKLKDKRVFATALNISDSDVEIVIRRISELFDTSMQNSMQVRRWLKVKNNLSCAGLLDEYAMTLPEL